MKDTTKVTIGVLLQVLLSVGSVIFLLGGLISFSMESPGKGGVLVVLGIICIVSAIRIRYWFGNIVREMK